MGLLIRLAINAVALFVAAYFLPGITLGANRVPSTVNDWVTIAIVALIFGLLNAIIKPILTILTLPITIITLGLFIFVLNALMLLLTSWVAGLANLNFHVADFWTALLGSLVVSLVSWVLHIVFREG
ncbi:MAG TPA: phage holin family protein [Anaerolineae bacterium]